MWDLDRAILLNFSSCTIETSVKRTKQRRSPWPDRLLDWKDGAPGSATVFNLLNITASENDRWVQQLCEVCELSMGYSFVLRSCGCKLLELATHTSSHHICFCYSTSKQYLVRHGQYVILFNNLKSCKYSLFTGTRNPRSLPCWSILKV